MADRPSPIVKCDGCGQPGQRRPGCASPDHWFYIEAIDRTPGSKRAGRIFVTLACSEACRDGLWQRGPGDGVIDEAGTVSYRKLLTKETP